MHARRLWYVAAGRSRPAVSGPAPARAAGVNGSEVSRSLPRQGHRPITPCPSIAVPKPVTGINSDVHIDGREEPAGRQRPGSPCMPCRCMQLGARRARGAFCLVRTSLPWRALRLHRRTSSTVAVSSSHVACSFVLQLPTRSYVALPLRRRSDDSRLQRAHIKGGRKYFVNQFIIRVRFRTLWV